VRREGRRKKKTNTLGRKGSQGEEGQVSLSRKYRRKGRDENQSGRRVNDTKKGKGIDSEKREEGGKGD